MNAVREQIRSMLRVEGREGGFSAEFRVGAELAIFPDHFRGAPILPGVCMVQAVLLAAGESLGVGELKVKTLKNAKMMRPIRPGDEVRIEGSVVDGVEGSVVVKATFTTDVGQKCGEFSVVAVSEKAVSAFGRSQPGAAVPQEECRLGSLHHQDVDAPHMQAGKPRPQFGKEGRSAAE